MAQDHQKDTKPSEDRSSGQAMVEAIGRAVGAAAQSAGHAYERFVGWLAIVVLWIARAKSPELLRRWREKGRK
jgi:hypothetical protein